MAKLERDDIRLQRLRVAVKLLLWIACMAVLFVSFAHFGGQTSSKDSNPDFEYILPSVVAGTLVAFLWNGQPMLVYRRTNSDIASLSFNNSILVDPASTKSRQPDFAINARRSAEPEWFVAYNQGTDFGCTVALKAESISDLSTDEIGSRYLEDTCRHSRYDVAGRVLKGFLATENLPVPNYRISDGILILKSD